MDIKVDLGNILDGSHESTNNAGAWLREHLQIPSNCSVIDQFEEYFNCRIIMDDRNDAWMEPTKIVFESSADLTAFVLKWS